MKRLLPLLSATALLAVVAPAQTRYTITPIQPLPGAFSSGARGLGQTGDVAGSSNTGMPEAWLFRDRDGVIPLGSLPGTTWSAASDVNDLGQAVGESGSRAFRHDPVTGMQDLAGGQLARAHAINNRGQVAGTLNPDGFFDFRPFVYDDAAGLTVLTPGTIGRAFDINESGQVAGYAGARAFRYTPGVGVEYLPFVADYPLSYGYAINRRGDVVGMMTSANGNTAHMFLYTDAAGLSDLGLFHGGPGAINRDGLIVGVRTSGGDKAFVRTLDGVVHDLNTLLVSGAAEYLLTSATDVNDAGQISCVAWHRASFRYHGVRLDPVDPTAVSVPVGLGCGALAPALDSSLPVRGGSMTFRVDGGPASASGLLFVAFSTPTRWSLGAGCTVFLQPTGLLPLLPVTTDATGRGVSAAVPIPDDPALAGFAMTVQGGFVGVGAPAGFDLTNGVLLVVGS